MRILVTKLILVLLATPSFAKEEEPKKQPKKNIRILTFKDKKNAQEIRAKSIRSIKQLLSGTKDAARRYELLRRYGELFAEQAEYALEKEMIIFERNFDDWEKKGKKGKEPILDNKNSQHSLRKAVSIYKEIVQKYANYPGVDITYYELGKNLLRLDNDSGLKYLNKLLKDHPKSLYVPEALFALGEYYFEKHDMPKSKIYYNQAAKYKNHEIYPYAVYKLGWTYYNFPANSPEEEKAKFDKAITAFKLVVQLASKHSRESDRAIYLRQEAINDLITVWAETADVDSAWKYFKKIGDTEAFYKMLERLGKIYVDRGELDQAIIVYQRILREVPNRDSNPDNHKKLVNIYKDKGDHAKVVETARSMVKLYLKGGKWYQAHLKDKDVLTDAEYVVESNIHRWATTYHDEGNKRKGRNETHYKVAAKLYMTYLNNFPKNEKAYELRFYLAEALFELKSYDNAATQYFLVVDQDKKGKYLKPAALNAVLAMNFVVSASKFEDPAEPGTIKKPIAIPAKKQKLRKGLDQYAQLFPKDKETQAMMLSAAKITYDYGHYKDAIARFDHIVGEYRGSKQSEKSAEAILFHFKSKEDWDKTIEYSKKYLAGKGILKGKLRKSTHELLVFASFERALQFEKNKQPIKAAEAFLAFQKDFPKEENAPVSIYNAMLLFRNNGYIDRALDAAKLVLKTYPKFKRRDDVLVAISEAYEGMGDYANAATFYALFAKYWPKDKRAPKYLFAAAVLYKGAKKNDDSINAYRSYLSAYPNGEAQIAAHTQLAEILEEEGRFEEAIAVHQKVKQVYKASREEAALASVKIVTLKKSNQYPNGNPRELAQLQKYFTSKNAPTARKARRELSEALFRNLEPSFKAFATARIPNSDVNKLQKGIQDLQNNLVRLADQYRGIISLGYPDHVVASTYRLGQAHEAFAIIIRSTPAPADFNKEEKETLAKQLVAASEPLTAEAIKFYKSAFSRANEAGVFTVWASRAYDRMSKLDEAKNPVINTFAVEPGYASHAIDYDKTVATVLH